MTLEEYYKKFNGCFLLLSGGPWNHIFGDHVWEIANLDGELMLFKYAKGYMDEYGYRYAREVDIWKNEKDGISIDYFPYLKMFKNQLDQTTIQILSMEEFDHIRINRIIGLVNKDRK